MPGGRFFKLLAKKVKPKTIPEGNQLIQDILANIGNDSQFDRLKWLITQRKTAFLAHIRTLEAEPSKQPFIAAYVHFAKNLKDYIEHPNDINQRISNYHNSNYYYHVGGINNKWSYTFADQYADYLLKFALILLVASIVATPFNLTWGLVTLGLAITLIGPSGIYAWAVTKKNASKVRAQETELFLEAQKMVDPEGQASLAEQEPEESALLPLLSCC